MIIEELRTRYIENRVEKVDWDLLVVEESLAEKKDLELLVQATRKSLTNLPNPHNSIILYVTGTSDEFDLKKGRSDTTGGSPPDIDMDFDSLDIDKVIDYLKERWGPSHVASIMAVGKFKPRGLVDRWFDIVEAPYERKEALTRLIPEAKYGKEPTLDMVKSAIPLTAEDKFEDFFACAERLEGLVNRFSVHAAGLVLTNEETSDLVPLYSTKDYSAITQYDKDELESIGLLKLDLLTIENLSVVKEVTRLVRANHGVSIDINTIPDGDGPAYALLQEGLLAGIFQMETSGSAKKLLGAAGPQSIKDLSALTSLNRPGPAQCGMADQYLKQRISGKPPEDMPVILRRILKETSWTIVYQEQCMMMFSEMAGFSPLEADNLRRGLGKKNATKIAKYREGFIGGCVNTKACSREYAESLWAVLAGDPKVPGDSGFCDYSFNKSHAVT